MSHWTKVKTKISNLDVLKQAIENIGCKFVPQKQFSSMYAGTIDCVGAIGAEGQEISSKHGAAVTQHEDGYQIVMDNYGNSLKDVAGENCRKITRKYAEITTTSAMVNAGYLKASSTIDQKTGDLLVEYVQ